MDYKHNIFGCQTNGNQSFADKFETLYDDGGSFHQSKEVFRHDVDDDLNFDYRICVEVIDWQEATGEDDKEFILELKLVPEFKSLSPKHQASVLSCCGIDEAEVNAWDVSSYGLNVMLASEECHYDELDAKLEAVANVFESINSLRGFYLDRYVNRIGNTGWDLLFDFINGEDYVKAALGRLA